MHLHRQLLVVGADVRVLEDRRDLVLAGRDLVVAGLDRHAELDQLALGLEHAGEHALRDRAEVVVVELVALRRLGAEQRAAGRDQVGALEVVLLVDQEVLLLGADRREDALGVARRRAGAAPGSPSVESASIERSSGILASSASPVHEANAVGMQSSVAVRVLEEEGGAGRVPGGVAAGLEGGADAAGRERGGVGLALDQLLAGEARRSRRRRRSGSKNESCFSAVEPVSGWNMWV